MVGSNFRYALRRINNLREVAGEDTEAMPEVSPTTKNRRKRDKLAENAVFK
jgi:hypothetical protein